MLSGSTETGHLPEEVRCEVRPCRDPQVARPVDVVVEHVRRLGFRPGTSEITTAGVAGAPRKVAGRLLETDRHCRGGPGTYGRNETETKPIRPSRIGAVQFVLPTRGGAAR
ncbi:hypothetical protein GCM10010433_75060 [Streptomyces pulveraceus]